MPWSYNADPRLRAELRHLHEGPPDQAFSLAGQVDSGTYQHFAYDRKTAHNPTMEGFCELPREQAATSRASLKGAVVAIGGTWKSAAHTDAREIMYEFCVQKIVSCCWL